MIVETEADTLLSNITVMDKILTIIIPTYNMEDFLPYCLNSLLIKEGADGLEVLIINDGSKDSSSEIAHEYERRYPDTFRVIDKENGNYGSCVNRGLKEARGKYVKVLDADDSFETDNFQRFLLFLGKSDADLVLSDFNVVDTNRTVRKTIRYDLGSKTEFCLEDICTTRPFKYMQMHAVTYKLDILRTLDYHQTEGISYTDQQWIFLPMIAVKNVSRFALPVYDYLVGRAGQSIRLSDKLKVIAQIVPCVLDMARGYECHKSNFEGKPIQDYLYARIIPLLKGVYVDAWQIYGEPAKKLLSDFDCRLQQVSPEFYNYIGKPEVSSFMGFEYIRYWRKHHNLNALLVKLCSKAYVLQQDLRRSTQKDDMAVPGAF